MMESSSLINRSINKWVDIRLWKMFSWITFLRAVQITNKVTTILTNWACDNVSRSSKIHHFALGSLISISFQKVPHLQEPKRTWMMCIPQANVSMSPLHHKVGSYQCCSCSDDDEHPLWGANVKQGAIEIHWFSLGLECSTTRTNSSTSRCGDLHYYFRE